VAALAATCLSVTGLAPSHAGARATVTSFTPSLGHVFLIVGENKELSAINSSNAPYIMGTLRHRSAWLTHYYAVTHHSEANYVAMTSGQFDSCEQRDGVCSQNVGNIFSQLNARGMSWRIWAVSMPRNCDHANSGSDSTYSSYVQRHNPGPVYANLGNCTAYDIPTGSKAPPGRLKYLDRALSDGTVARFTFIAPNLCEDGHDSCGGSNSVTEYNNFLKLMIPRIEASPAFGARSVIFSTYDEGSTNLGGGGNVMMAVTGPLVRPGTYSSAYDHYSLLRTIEQSFGITTYLRNAASAHAFSGIWR
jgi:hypothetical protein